MVSIINLYYSSLFFSYKVNDNLVYHLYYSIITIFTINWHFYKNILNIINFFYKVIIIILLNLQLNKFFVFELIKFAYLNDLDELTMIHL